MILPFTKSDCDENPHFGEERAPLYKIPTQKTNYSGRKRYPGLGDWLIEYILSNIFYSPPPGNWTELQSVQYQSFVFSSMPAAMFGGGEYIRYNILD